MVPQQRAQRKKRSLKSRFKATAGKYFFLKLGVALLSIIPIFGFPNAVCIFERYKCRNTEIVGMPLEFVGKAGNLLKNLIVWGFFTVITIGIYGLFMAPLRFQQWKTANTVFGPIMM